MEKKIWEERRKKKIVLPKEPEPEKKDYRRWTKYIIAGVFVILFFTLLRGKKEKIEIPGPETLKPPAPAAAPEKPETKAAPAPTTVPETPPKSNVPPEILSIKLSPKVVYPGTKIKAEVSARDADEDEVAYFYEWRKNDNALPDNDRMELDTTGFKKGELVTLFVTPFDGKDKGKKRFSKTIVMANRPLEITSVPSTAISNGKYIYEVKAADPDNDTLTFSLEEAPLGMTIAPATGVIRWNIPIAADLKSIPTYTIRVAVSDGDATAFQGFAITPNVEIK